MLAQITPQELHRRLTRGEAMVLLDVREPEELALAQLPNVVHIPMGEIPGRVHQLDPDAEIVVICHHGIRSAHVARFLAQRDFTRVLNLAGGLDAWSTTVDSSVPRY
jgi:adenylyltransferase/sulfurtransferase